MATLIVTTTTSTRWRNFKSSDTPSSVKAISLPDCFYQQLYAYSVKTLSIATLSLFQFTAEYCDTLRGVAATNQSHSSHQQAHQRIVQRIVTGCLRSTPTDNLPVLEGIKPADF